MAGPRHTDWPTVAAIVSRPNASIRGTGLASLAWQDEATAVQEPRVRQQIEEFQRAGRTGEAAGLARLFYGGGLMPVTIGNGRGRYDDRPEHPFRPRHDPANGWRIDLDRELSPGERDRATHLARPEVAAKSHRTRIQREQWRMWHTCDRCSEQNDRVHRRTVRVTGPDEVAEGRLCDACEAAATAELRARRDAVQRPNRRTRRDLIAEWLDSRRAASG
jgi:hypothetical protein